MIRTRKVWPEYFQDILDGKKNFELRLGNFECEIGDILTLVEWDPILKKETGRTLNRKITYVINTKDLDFWTEQEKQEFGFKVMSLKEE